MEDHRFYCKDCEFVTKHWYNNIMEVFICDFCGCEIRSSESDEEEEEINELENRIQGN